MALPCPAVSVTVPTKVRRRSPGHRHFADQAVTSPPTQPISVFIHVDAFNGRTNDGQQTTTEQKTDLADLDDLLGQLDTMETATAAATQTFGEIEMINMPDAMSAIAAT